MATISRACARACEPSPHPKSAAQAQYRHGYCLTQVAIVGTLMEDDHILPEALSGLTMESNLWLARLLCNDYKNNRIAVPDSDTGEPARLFNPRE